MDVDRLAITQTTGGTEYVVLESQTIVDYGHGQGPQGGVVTVKDGWVTVQGAGNAKLDGGTEEQGGTFPASLALRDPASKLTVEIAAHADPTGQPPDATVYLEGSSGQLRIRDAGGNEHALLDGAGGNLWLGGKSADGDVVLYKKGQKDNRDASKATIHLDGDASSITLRDEKGNDHALLDASGNLWLGGKKADGDVVLFKEGESDNRNADKATIHLDGNAGDIVLRNADCAEDFDVGATSEAEPGTVMVIDRDGRLQPSRLAYDRKVAGVVSGAGACRPGIVLDRQAGRGARRPVALVGKVYCKADATSGPIDVGDLLTTSSTPGHAMRADDRMRAFGAVIGKALAPLTAGMGLIPILVALQ